MAKSIFTKTKARIKDLSPERKERALKLLEKAEFMETELTKLQDILREKGWTEEYQNGANQHGIKKSTEGEIYNAMIKNYALVLEKIENLFPKDESIKDDFMEFLEGKK